MKRCRWSKQIIGLLFFVPFLSWSQSILPYKNPRLSVDERVEDLLRRMTPEEKFWQLFMLPESFDEATKARYKNGVFGFQVNAGSNGTDAAQQMLTYNSTESGLQLLQKNNRIQKYFVEETRLGIPIIFFDEALHGVVRDGATAFPQAIALAATFDTALMKRISYAIARETKARGIRQVLSPVVNIATDVRWGRVEETYGEDPFLTSVMGVAFVSSFEKMNIITTPKHFVANVGDGGRDSYPIHANERLLEEIHFAPFKACFNLGHSRSVMTSYNSVDGTPSTSNNWLLNKKLKHDWNFKGFVISDAGAVGGSIVLHHTSTDYPNSGEQAINGGLDVIFQTQYDHYKLFQPPFLDGRIDKEKIDDAVRRVLRAKFELGLFENPYTSEDEIKRLATSSEHKKIALEAAQKSIVLLKNDNVLPLSKKIKTITVIGIDAIEARLGGYSGKGNKPVSILSGIKTKIKSSNVNFFEGCGRSTEEWRVIEGEFLSFDNLQGLHAEYFNNTSLEGKPALERQDSKINFHWTLYSPDSKINSKFYSIRWSGKLKSPITGNLKIGLDGNDGFRLYINEKLIVDQWLKQSYHTSLSDFYFEKDKLYDIRIEFKQPIGNGHIKLIWDYGAKEDWKQKIQKAVEGAKQSDVAIIVVGIQEGEFQDRALLSLPGHQEEMINQVAAAGKPVIVVLIGGSAITMTNWIKNVNAIIDAWYPGEEGGNALADILFGDYNPAGRLPITFPLHEGQLPLIYNHKPTGRGDDYNNLSGEPLFPFGFGMSYTQFEYKNIRLEKESIRQGESVKVYVTIRNIGKLDGDEVVQLYVKDELASVARPLMELKGFQRIFLKAQEEKEIQFNITTEMLSMLDKDLKTVIEPGDFSLMIGASSKDIRQIINLNVK